jgi:hypothetical protein
VINIFVLFSDWSTPNNSEYLIIRAALNNSAREDCEENLRQKKAENRRNTLCISRFDNAFLAEISRKTPQMQLFGVAQKQKVRTKL